MARHSKRNTSASFFTSYERSLLKHYGRQSQRLSADSFRSFDACYLCLMRARDPVACPDKGHLFCRECIVQNLISQRVEITSKLDDISKKIAEKEHSNEIKSLKRHNQQVLEFEQSQRGLSKIDSSMSNDRPLVYLPTTTTAALPPKRKHSQDSDEEEQDQGDYESLVQTKKELLAVTSLCPISDPEIPHALTLKALLPIHFSTLESKDTQTVCPSCLKKFGLSTDAYLTRPCGHLICKHCFDTAMKPMHPGEPFLCFVCQLDLSPHSDSVKSTSSSSRKSKKKTKSVSPGVIFIPHEGTGFSGGGKAVIEKEGIAFQG
ncbi:uncharacterized protein V1516DRAFT_663432 [Lipomyces oligophaga]|uniref:uncharacterized protein n=1 Tax=Lipomyces oligophaga TaxID=45792 RepID=UPI0034CF6124